MNILWETPCPSTAFMRDVSCRLELGRRCSLSFEYEDQSGLVQPCELTFDDIASFKVTYLAGLTVEMIESAYDRLVDMGSTAWLQEVAESATQTDDFTKRRHLRICFDDGPCYEFICAQFEIRGQCLGPGSSP